MLTITPLPAFTDNYIWLITHSEKGNTVAVDPGEAAPVLKYCEDHQLSLSAILITHHHADHTGGIEALVRKFPNIPVFGPQREPIKGVTETLSEGAHLQVPGIDLALSVLEVPGHTSGHIAYYNTEWLFCGDTLFSGGCGRLFEGTPAQMLDSLAKLAALPDETAVFCTHEYTLNNLRFAKTLEPDNSALLTYIAHCQKQRKRGLPTLPSTIGQEKAINPFLRCHLPTLQDLAPNAANTLEAFTWVRQQKDVF